MVKMISYIFGNLETSENTIKNIQKALRNQAMINRNIAVFALVMTAYTIVQNKKIEELSNKIEEFKRMKGE